MDEVADFANALERLRAKHSHFAWEADFGDVAVIIAQVQLALRHPGNRGYSADRARKIVEAMIEAMEQSDPAAGRYLRMGFDPSHDVVR